MTETSPTVRKPGSAAVMTPRERVLAVLQHREPDRVPHFEWVHDRTVIKRLTKGGDYFDLVQLLDIDGVVVSPAYRRQPIDGGMLMDEWGAVRVIGKDDYAMVVEDRVPIRNESDLEQWRVPDPHDPYRYEALQEAVTRFGHYRAMIFQARDVWSSVRDYMGYEGALIALINQPRLVEAVVAKCVDHYIAVIQHAAELGADVVFTGDDIADNKGPIFSPRLFDQLLMPHYRRLVRAIHEAGLYHWKHSDGNMYPFLDRIVDAGTDGIDPIDPLGGMELAVVKAKYGPRVAIKGNVDQTQLLSIGPPEKVVESVKSCIRQAGAQGGYVCSSSNSIHSGVDPQLYVTMVEAIHRYGQYPLDMDLLGERESCT
jgi:uroporphyrinogen decarboxylase